MRPRYFAAIRFVELAMSAVRRASGLLRLPDTVRQDPLYYRTNQFWRQLDEFRTELRRAAEGALPVIQAGGKL
jgi:hypothetical protein